MEDHIFGGLMMFTLLRDLNYQFEANKKFNVNHYYITPQLQTSYEGVMILSLTPYFKCFISY